MPLEECQRGGPLVRPSVKSRSSDFPLSMHGSFRTELLLVLALVACSAEGVRRAGKATARDDTIVSPYPTATIGPHGGNNIMLPPKDNIVIYHPIATPLPSPETPQPTASIIPTPSLEPVLASPPLPPQIEPTPMATAAATPFVTPSASSVNPGPSPSPEPSSAPSPSPIPEYTPEPMHHHDSCEDPIFHRASADAMDCIADGGVETTDDFDNDGVFDAVDNCPCKANGIIQTFILKVRTRWSAWWLPIIFGTA